MHLQSLERCRSLRWARGWSDIEQRCLPTRYSRGPIRSEMDFRAALSSAPRPRGRRLPTAHDERVNDARLAAVAETTGAHPNQGTGARRRWTCASPSGR